MIKLKRAYEPASKDDGLRILVERLWPRGVSKQKAQIDLWLKDLASARNAAPSHLFDGTHEPLDSAARPSLSSTPSTPAAHEGHWDDLHFHRHPACAEWHGGLCRYRLLARRERAVHGGHAISGTNSSGPHGGTAMPDHVLRVGEELVIEGRIRLTILAVEEGKILFGITTAAEPSGVRGPVARQRRPRMAAVPVPLPSDN
jgi:hypothetical protein